MAHPPELSGAPDAVFLVGFMGAGKTTVGKASAARLRWQFVDLDDLIVEHSGRSIEDIFRYFGESEFRKLERQELASLLARLGPQFHAVVALGGGAYVQQENFQRIAAAGHPVVFLDAPVEELWQRCQQPLVARPLRQNQAQFRARHALRLPYYVKSTLRVDTSGRGIEEIAAGIVAALKLDRRRQEPSP
jgi:shikimate kinase